MAPNPSKHRPGAQHLARRDHRARGPGPTFAEDHRRRPRARSTSFKENHQHDGSTQPCLVFSPTGVTRVSREACRFVLPMAASRASGPSCRASAGHVGRPHLTTQLFMAQQNPDRTRCANIAPQVHDGPVARATSSQKITVDVKGEGGFALKNHDQHDWSDQLHAPSADGGHAPALAPRGRHPRASSAARARGQGGLGHHGPRPQPRTSTRLSRNLTDHVRNVAQVKPPRPWPTNGTWSKKIPSTVAPRPRSSSSRKDDINTMRSNHFGPSPPTVLRRVGPARWANARGPSFGRPKLRRWPARSSGKPGKGLDRERQRPMGRSTYRHRIRHRDRDEPPVAQRDPSSKKITRSEAKGRGRHRLADTIKTRMVDQHALLRGRGDSAVAREGRPPNRGRPSRRSGPRRGVSGTWR